MVLVPGCGFHSGAGSLYDPAALVEAGVTVVTINYLVRALGFVALPALAEAHGRSGDYGLMECGGGVMERLRLLLVIMTAS